MEFYIAFNVLTVISFFLLLIFSDPFIYFLHKRELRLSDALDYLPLAGYVCSEKNVTDMTVPAVSKGHIEALLASAPWGCTVVRRLSPYQDYHGIN